MAKADLRKFDYLKVAELDADMWRSYYNHKFVKLFWQLLRLFRTQLHLNWLTTLRLAFYSGWAATDYRINRKNLDNKRVLKNLDKYYKVISNHSIEPFDYTKAAYKELEWWEIHRASTINDMKLEESLAEAAAVMYNISPNKLKKYAHFRGEAMILPGHVGDKQNATNWPEVHRLLRNSWKSLHSAVQK